MHLGQIYMHQIHNHSVEQTKMQESNVHVKQDEVSCKYLVENLMCICIKHR